MRAGRPNAQGYQTVTPEAWECLALVLPAGLQSRPAAAPTARPAGPMAPLKGLAVPQETRRS
eukprot:13570747-Alexandrium_andersonii.AAC.1